MKMKYLIAYMKETFTEKDRLNKSYGQNHQKRIAYDFKGSRASLKGSKIEFKLDWNWVFKNGSQRFNRQVHGFKRWVQGFWVQVLTRWYQGFNYKSESQSLKSIGLKIIRLIKSISL